jgi:hypothetical protein
VRRILLLVPGRAPALRLGRLEQIVEAGRPAVADRSGLFVDESSPWVMQSLFGEARDKGAKALETFAYRYAEGESQYERFQVHKTIFPADFLSDFGFFTVRSAGRLRPRRPDP